MNRLVCALPIFVSAVCLAQSNSPLLLQKPALSRTQIVFVYAGDLWTVPREGGEAKRLTAGAGIKTNPAFSPDGSQIAFTGEYDGNVDVFVIPAEGGVPKRLTWHPAPDIALGWTPDGKRILFSSPRTSYSRGCVDQTLHVRPRVRLMNRTCRITSPFSNHLTCPFRIMCITSKPGIVR